MVCALHCSDFLMRFATDFFHTTLPLARCVPELGLMPPHVLLVLLVAGCQGSIWATRS
jgi:hypothetical protein